MQLIPKSADEACEVLVELQECYKNAFKKSEDPDFINVLVDIMISLLTKSSSVLRDIVRIVFTAFSDILNEEVLHYFDFIFSLVFTMLGACFITW